MMALEAALWSPSNYKDQETFRVSDMSVAQGPEGCLCSHIGHLYRGLDTHTDQPHRPLLAEWT